MFKAVIDVIVVMVTATIQLPVVIVTEISIMWLKMKIAVKTYLCSVAFPEKGRKVPEENPPYQQYKTMAEINKEIEELDKKLQNRLDEYEKKHNIKL
jgi:hypothetical protein